MAPVPGAEPQAEAAPAEPFEPHIEAVAAPSATEGGTSPAIEGAGRSSPLDEYGRIPGGESLCSRHCMQLPVQ